MSFESTAFKPTQLVADWKSPKIFTEDQIYWKKLQTVGLSQETSHVTSVRFNPTNETRMVATCSTKVVFYDTATLTPVSTLSRFKKAVYGPAYRSDGNLLAVGGEEGRLRVFDPNSSTTPLRFYKAHERPIHACSFGGMFSSGRIVSFSDDQTVKCFDVSATSSVPLSTFSGHTDVVRSGCVDKSNSHLIFSGSYDHTVRVWDVRSPANEGSKMTLNHGQPVETILLLPNETLLATAGGTVVKIWDLSCVGDDNGGGALAQLSRHHKSITTLKLCSNGNRLVSAGIDCMLNFYDVSNYKHVFSMKYQAPILDADISARDSYVAVSMTTGNQLSVQRRCSSTLDSPTTSTDRFLSTTGSRPKFHKRKKNKSGKRQDQFYKLPSTANITNDVVVTAKTEPKLQRYDKFMKTFRHSKALDYVIKSRYFAKRRPEVVVSVFRELKRRGALRNALGGRTHDGLEPILKFLSKFISRPPFAHVLLAVAHCLLDVYRPKLTSLATETAELLRRLKDSVKEELDDYPRLYQLAGCVDMLSSQKTVLDSKTDDGVDDTTAVSPADILGNVIVRRDITA